MSEQQRCRRRGCAHPRFAHALEVTGLLERDGECQTRGCACPAYLTTAPEPPSDVAEGRVGENRESG